MVFALTCANVSRSGFFLTQAIMIYTLGIILYMHLSTNRGMSTVPRMAICLLVSVTATVLGAEVFYRVIDHPSQVLAMRAFDWIREIDKGIVKSTVVP